MNKFPYRALQLILLFSIIINYGCTKQHTIQVNDDSLLFKFSDPKASEVFFVSSTDHFRYHPATKGSNNVWQVTVPLNKKFTYFYIVDGVVTLPGCPNTVLDDFGAKNCLYVFGM
jgi:hypothetical protein